MPRRRAKTAAESHSCGITSAIWRPCEELAATRHAKPDKFRNIDRLDWTWSSSYSARAMTGLITGVPGLLPTRLTYGTLLPVVVFVLLTHLAVEPLVPERWEVVQAVEQLEPEWRLAVVAFLTVLVTGLLYVLNVPLIRLYEGYLWEESGLGRWLARRQRARLAAIETTERFLGYLVRELKTEEPENLRIEELEQRRDEAGRAKVSSYPRISSVLPTRLGNVIRAFENYPYRQYGMSGIELWPRLLPLIPSEHAKTIETAKTRFDFMLNASALSVALGLLVLTTAVFAPLEPGDGTLAEIAVALACAGLSVAFYRGSVGRAEEWGGHVKAAFDLYRRKLLVELGIRSVPTTLREERDLWHELRLQITFLDPWDGSAATLRFEECAAPRLPMVIAAEGAEGLEFVRGVKRLRAGRLRVILEVENSTGERRTGIEVVDTLAPGWEYAYGSATAGGVKANVRGDRYLRIDTGELIPGARIEIAYTMIQRDQRNIKEDTT